jgi:hypothetical protein
MTMRIRLLNNIEALAAAFSGPVPNSVVRVLLTVGLDGYAAKNMAKTVANKSGFHIDTYDRAVQAFSDAWPEYLAWPEGIDRPEPSERPESKDAAA